MFTFLCGKPKHKKDDHKINNLILDCDLGQY